MTSLQRLKLNKMRYDNKLLAGYLALIEPDIKRLLISTEQIQIWKEFKDNIINTGDIELDFVRKMLEREVIDVN